MCDCGETKEIRVADVKRGKTQSCGCHKKETSRQMLTTHWLSNNPEHSVWSDMKWRCYNKNDYWYKNYGGRWITVCDEWANSFETFNSDMWPRPSDKHSIDRIDVEWNYCKENCKWATRSEQNNNKRNSNIIEYQWKRLTITQWSRIVWVRQQTIWRRYFKQKLSIEKILSLNTF